jgi:aminopeptidase
MTDPRMIEHAKFIVRKSTRVRKNDNIVIHIDDEGMELAVEIYKEAAGIGAHAMIIALPSEALRGELATAPTDALTFTPKHTLSLISYCDVYIGVRSDSNLRSLASIDPKSLALYSKGQHPINEARLTKRWCLTQYPNDAYAQEAGMSLSEYQDFVYRAILLDVDEQHTRMEKLATLMKAADNVRLIGEKTDLEFSIKGRTPVISDPIHNVPSGEVFTAPLDTSANGEIYFDLPAIRLGREVRGVHLNFKNGKVVDMSAEQNEDFLREQLDIDDGAKRLGEFGVGMNLKIDRFTKNILFDEKIGGTIHLAMGRAYKENGGTNESILHWDFIKNMRQGKIMMDGKTIQENGRFLWESPVQPTK